MRKRRRKITFSKNNSGSQFIIETFLKGMISVSNAFGSKLDNIIRTKGFQVELVELSLKYSSSLVIIWNNEKEVILKNNF